MTYRSVVATRRGGPDVLQITENPLQEPRAGEVRIRVLAVPVCRDDVATRVGNRPFLPKVPFVPGYSILGVVDAVGPGVTAFAVGERVAALIGTGGYTEVITLGQEQLVRVPETLDPAAAVVLILNYLVAYQVLHHVAQVQPGDSALIVGASGGVGTAFLELGKLAGVRMVGLASGAKHGLLREYGAVPIDYRTQDFVDVLRRTEPAGLDFVFNGMDEAYIGRGVRVLRRGGVLVHYGGPESLFGFFTLIAKFLWFNVLPNGKRIKGYGTHRGDIARFKEDWARLFELLAAGQIRPIIAETFPLLEAAQANALLESGRVAGHVVLLAPELL